MKEQEEKIKIFFNLIKDARYLNLRFEEHELDLYTTKSGISIDYNIFGDKHLEINFKREGGLIDIKLLDHFNFQEALADVITIIEENLKTIVASIEGGKVARILEIETKLTELNTELLELRKHDK